MIFPLHEIRKAEPRATNDFERMIQHGTAKRHPIFTDYIVTIDGLVISTKRANPCPRKPFLNKNGYLYLRLYKNGLAHTQAVHRMVCDVFIANPENLRCVNHKNFDRLDNKIDNLEWCTHGDNMKHTTAANRQGTPKMPVAAVLNTGSVSVFESIKEASRSLGINAGSISRAIRQQTLAGGVRFELV